MGKTGIFGRHRLLEWLVVSVEGSSSVWVDLVGAGLTVSPHGPGLKILLVGFVELDQTKLASIRATMADRDRQILSSFAQANVRGVHVPDDALRQYARERLFLPIVPEGTSCTCGQLLDAAHVHSCPSLGAARIRRHDNIKLLVAKLAARTYTVRVEPSRRTPRASRSAHPREPRPPSRRARVSEREREMR